MSPDRSAIHLIEDSSVKKLALLKQMRELLHTLKQADEEDSQTLLNGLDEIDKIRFQIDEIDLTNEKLKKSLSNETQLSLSLMQEDQNVPDWGLTLNQLFKEQFLVLKEISVMHAGLLAKISSVSEGLKNRLKDIKHMKKLSSNYYQQNTLEAGSILNYKEREK